MVIDGSGSELHCSDCGLVVKEKIVDVGPEWRSFSSDEKGDRSRTGTPTSIAIHDMGLATVIGALNKDASGKSLSGSMKSTVERLRTWDRRSQAHESTDRNLRQAFSELRRFADKLTVSEAVTEKAAYFYRKALERKLVRGRSITAMMAASLYAACRDVEIPRTLKDVAAVSNVKKKDLARSYRLLHREMDLKMPVAEATRCVSGIASRARMSEKSQRRAREILLRAKLMGISAGKDPMGLAASALYVACTLEGEEKTQKDVAEAAGVTEVTIRNRYKGLREALGI
ncbi:MAG: transcription initiation factor IIB [Nitrososphaerales archaeon]|nr:transcription initiation factor IIB [Nitrososphaerales archaeon]